MTSQPAHGGFAWSGNETTSQNPLLDTKLSTCRKIGIPPILSVDRPEKACQPVVSSYARKSGKHGFCSGFDANHLYGMFPARPMVAQKIEKQGLTKALEEKILALAREHGGKLNAILRGSDVAFKQAKDRSLDQLEDHLRASMTKLYAPEQITRRKKEVESQFFQNMADPDRQKGLNGLMRFMASAVGLIQIDR